MWFENIINWLSDSIFSSPQATDENSTPLLGDIEMGLGEQGPAPMVDLIGANTESITPYYIAEQLGLLIFSKENAPRITVAAFLTGITTGLNFLSPYLFSEAINLLSSDEEETNIAGITLNRNELITALIASFALAHSLPAVRDKIMIPVTLLNTTKVLKNGINHLLKKSLNYHVNTEFGDQIVLIQKGFTLSSIGTPLLTQIAPTIVETTIACGLLSSQYGIEMGVGIAALLSTYVIYSVNTTKPIIDAREKSLQINNAFWEAFFSAVTRYKTMRDCGRLDDTIASQDIALANWAQAEIHAAELPLTVGFGHLTISYTSMLAAALYVGSGVQSGRYTIQDFVLIIGYLQQLSSLLPAFGQAVNQLVAAYPDLKYVFSELAKPDEVVDLYPFVPLLLSKGVAPSIEFENVEFSYPPKPGQDKSAPIFTNLSFKIESNERVAFVSKSGVGKTTIFNLLYGYYAPSKGKIKINGQDIWKVSLVSVQNQIGLFGQDPNLFKGTLRENICYGAQHPELVTDEMILKIAADVNLSEFIEGLPNKLDTQVGETGKSLSGGQRQKAAILRGMLKQTSIRMLDEVTAPFDSQAAMDVLQRINQSAEGMTSLMITHKLTEVQYVDRIFVLDEGKVLAAGSHDELLQTCTLYQGLWRAYNEQNTDKPAPVCVSSTGFFSKSTEDRTNVKTIEETNHFKSTV